MHHWSVHRDIQAASVAAAEFITSEIKKSLSQQASCHVILPGGNTPSVCLAQLAQQELPWEKIHWYPGDERCVAVGDKERNDVMLQAHLWSKLDKPNIHCIPAELGAEQGAAEFAKSIKAIRAFDIAFLGLGEDGHTASLFPENPALEDKRSVVPVFNSPKPPPQRVSLGLTTLQQTRVRIVLAGGNGKAEIIKRIKANEDLPVNRLGDIHWFIDTGADPES